MEFFFFVIFFMFQSCTASTQVSSCFCGFRDPRTGMVWTDAIITYANETDLPPTDSLIAEAFQHANEKNWNARYRAGASPANIGFNESTAPGWNGNAWRLYIERPTKDHAVIGASLRSLRRDIQYGTFETALGPPEPGVGGSILAMRLEFNESQTLSVNVMNADDPKDAWTSFMIYGDFRGTRSKGVNFTDFGNSSYKFPTSPWGLVPYQIDWTDQKADFFIGTALARSIRARNSFKPWPRTPSTLYIQHSSIGDSYTSEGPPTNGSYANVGMIRAFFNSSLMTAADHRSFDARCRLGVDQCSVSDTTLRGSSPFNFNATTTFKEHSVIYKRRWPAIFVASICISISIILLFHALFKRAPWNSKTGTATKSSNSDPGASASDTSDGSERTSQYFNITSSIVLSEQDGSSAPAQLLGTSTPGAITPGTLTSGRTTPCASILTPGWAEVISSAGAGPCVPLPICSSVSLSSKVITTGPAIRDEGSNTRAPLNSFQSKPASLSDCGRFHGTVPRVDTSQTMPSATQDDSLEIYRFKHENAPEATVKEFKAPNSTVPPIATPKQRVDYLAGLVALASVLVTLIHFCLTFLPATEAPYTDAHYKSETWAFRIVTPYLLTFSWIGPFFTSSTRFLVTNYLKTGNLKGVAEKTVGRTPRLIIPCAAVAALEYFCMQVGALEWLEYLPSVTWSTWPYTSNYVTVGHFISEVIELMYIIPNAVPQITFNYCIGVLWTIPVQLQNSWISLLGVMIIREIKTPWKRMGYYAFCTLMHWYAMSWGSFFWVGLLIADLDISYQWKTWMYARPLVYYPFLAVITLIAFGSLSIDLVGQWTTINFNTLEYGVHPHQRTGRLIRESVDYGYPPYYLPRLTALTFSIGVHLLVELSPLVQKFFSNPLLLWLFPHILTLYLIHGLVFWSLGSLICVKLAAYGLPYWANIVVVAVCTYVVILGCLPILTPIIDTLGKSITMTIWRAASEKTAQRRMTLYPFSPRFLKDGEKHVARSHPKIDGIEKGTV